MVSRVIAIAFGLTLMVTACAAEFPPKKPFQTQLQPPKFESGTAPPYDSSYPMYYDMADILTAWSPLDPVPPVTSGPGPHTSLRYFDYKTERETIKEMLHRELPFVVQNIPSLEEARTKWTDEYLALQFDTNRLPVTESDSVHHMYGRSKGSIAKSRLRGKHGLVLGGGEGRNHTVNLKVGVTKRRDMDYMRWKALSTARDKRIEAAKDPGPTFYLRFSAPKWDFVTQDLKYFSTHWQKGEEGEIFMELPKHNRGIHCRVGMTGIIAESHYDHGRNFVSMIRGRKRYILNPPSECGNLPMIRQGRSSRHASTDWSDPKEIPKFRGVRALEVIINEGDALFIPAFWFHYIISLEENIQCNSRTDTPSTGYREISSCGFSARTSGRKTPELPSFDPAVRSFPEGG